ncbi:MAG: hypothetical protein HYV46_21960, partial [candidate division NC10 bacterium]|nr:hypothetical protein [candidate division NC10 bacterium]
MIANHPMAARYPACQVTAQALHSDWRTTEMAEIRLLVDTTSVGLQPGDPQRFEYASLSTPMVVRDLITSPPQIPLLQAARARGCRAGNRFCMRLHQGGLAFKPWT